MKRVAHAKQVFDFQVQQLLWRISNKGGLAAVNARVYAVKANLNRLLDVARETYKENIADIYQLNRVLSEEHGLPLTLVYQNMGFVFALKKNDIDGELPKCFVNTELKKGRWIFSSMELVRIFLAWHSNKLIASTPEKIEC